MEKEFGSWFPYQQYGLQASYWNFSDRLVPRGQNYVPAFMSPYMKEVPIKGTFPLVPGSGLPLSKASQPIEPCNWFYCMPRFRQAFVPPLASPQKEKPAFREKDNCGLNGSANVVSDGMEKKFLVFDRSGDQTTLIYNSGIETHGGRLPLWNPKPPVTRGVIEQNVLKENANLRFSPLCNLGLDQESLGNGLDNEMHEDTEELNALLDSDDENDYSEDDEVSITGHSPSTLTDHDIQYLSVEEDEVASSAGSTKRQKLSDRAYNVPSLVNTMVPEKPVKSHELEDDAESCCGNFENQVSEESLSLSGKKRLRKDDMRKTLSILQNLIPGAKGKNAMVVIDEAVHYLQFLKDKAESLDLDAM